MTFQKILLNLQVMNRIDQHTGFYRQVKWLIAAVIVLAIAFPVTTQGETMDSLYSIYLKVPSHDKLSTSNKIFQELWRCESMDTLLQFDRKDKASIVEAKTHYWMADYYFYQEKYEESTQACLRARNLIDDSTDDHMKSDIIGLLAALYFRLGQYDKSLEALLVAHHIDKKLNDKELISSDLNTLAAIYIAVKQPQPGIEYIEQAIAIERELKDENRLSIRLGLASELYLLNGEHDKAMKAIKEAYDIDRRNGRDEKAGIRLSQMGAILEAQSKIDEAQTILTQALSILEKNKNLYSAAVCHNQLGRIALKRGDRETAIMHHKNALEQSIKCGAPNVERDAERGLWEAMREVNPAVAMIHLERFTVLSDSLQSHIGTMQMNVMNATAHYMEQSELQKDSRRNRRLLAIAGCVLLLVILTAVIAMFNAWRRNKRAMQLQQQTQNMRSHFIDNITHELRTPLTAIIDAGQELKESAKVPAEEAHRLGSVISTHGNQMLTLVNQLLDVETANTITPLMRPGDIVMFIKLLVDNYADMAHRASIILEFSSPLKTLNVMFSPDHIRKIVHSLIANALKFTPATGRVTVQVSTPEKNLLLLQVADTGKGIPTQEIDKVFEPFYQSDLNHEGIDTAVDLTLVKQLVLSIDGNITVSSTPGQGTTFSITFPVQPAPENDANVSHSNDNRPVLMSQGSAHRLKPLVFIVENNDDFAFYIAHHLRQNFELRFASEGMEASVNIPDLAPDLVITNVTLPLLDGKELIRKIRDNQAIRHIPVIALTLNPSDEERVSCIQAGADVVLVKPFNSMELLAQVQRLVDHHTQLKQHYSEVITQEPTSTINKEDREFIHRMMDIVEVQISKGDVDLERIAAAMSVTRQQLRQRVMAITGETPVAYILQMRLHKARRMIKNDENASLTVIAAKCGFQALSHFSKAFKQQFGISPMQYRKHHDSFNDNDSN